MLYSSFSLYAFTAISNVVTMSENPAQMLIPLVTLYNDLKCTPKYSLTHINLIEEFDCSHIFNRTKDTCHFNGQLYKYGNYIPSAELTGVLDNKCYCTRSGQINYFTCGTPYDGCSEYWADPKPGCYSRYGLNWYCARENLCPPFIFKAQCIVNGVTYREGDKIPHPNKKCTECVCTDGFEGKLEPPFCQMRRCNVEVRNSEAIDRFYAPFYKNGYDDCCPSSWIYPSSALKTIVYGFNTKALPNDNPNLQCKYGSKSMGIGETAVLTQSSLGEITCECILPPFLFCTTTALYNQGINSTTNLI